MRASLIAQIKDETVHGPTVAECAEKYLASRRHELGEKTVGQHRLLLGRLATFCEDRDAPYMHNLTVDLLETFMALPAILGESYWLMIRSPRILYAHGLWVSTLCA